MRYVSGMTLGVTIVLFGFLCLITSITAGGQGIGIGIFIIAVGALICPHAGRTCMFRSSGSPQTAL